MSIGAPHARTRAAATAIAAVLTVLALTGCAGGPVIDSLDRAIDRLTGDTADAGTDEAFDDDGAVSDEGNTTIDRIAFGNCLNDATVPTDTGQVMSLNVIDCGEPHDSEVFAFSTYDLDDYPAEDELYELGDEGCFDEFEDYVGLDYDSSILDFSHYPPSREGWKYGDRDTMCVLFDMDEKQLTESMQDSGR